MKRILAALFLALVVALVGTIGVASADPPHDFTTGGGKVERTFFSDSDSQTLEEKFAFSAHHEGDSSSTTVARNGHYVYHRTVTSSDGTILSSFVLKGSVDCLRVSGNQAAFSGPIEKSSTDLAPVGGHAFFIVEDNVDTPDGFTFISVTGAGSPAESCSENFGLEIFPITSGNILVNDAP